MKAVIWIVGIFVISFIHVTVFNNQPIGLLPTLIIYGAWFALLRYLCRLWDKHKLSKDEEINQAASGADETQMLSDEGTVPVVKKQCTDVAIESEDNLGYEPSPTVFQEQPNAPVPVIKDETESRSQNATPILFCRKCGFKLLEGSEYCSRCGTPITKQEDGHGLC